jgi:tRNA threonylcarbamoyladenosine biosynthesis protein TsaB
MLTIALRTDKPEAEIGLYDGSKQLAYHNWTAHRQLAETIHLKIKELLEQNHKSWTDIKAVAVYKGPGSFTGLRIGLSVANAIADSLKVPIVGGENEGWLEEALLKLANGNNDKLIVPKYGAPPHITQPKR